ncbi:heparin-binding hemagglutinin [Rhodococcus sp. WS4]|nr:heparin-binding hemagglutinin [Rhodococcus sp. WS4]
MSESTDKTIENVKKPLYATVGAGDVAVQAAADVVAEVRERAENTGTDVSGWVEEARERFASLPTDVQEQIEALRQRLAGLPSELPGWAELREKFTVEELRKVAEEYLKGVVDLYADLAERGEGAVERLRTRPGVDERIERAEDAADTAADHVDEANAAVAKKAPAKKTTS